MNKSLRSSKQIMGKSRTSHEQVENCQSQDFFENMFITRISDILNRQQDSGDRCNPAALFRTLVQYRTREQKISNNECYKSCGGIQGLSHEELRILTYIWFNFVLSLILIIQAWAMLCQAEHSLNQLLTSYKLHSFYKDSSQYSIVLIQLAAAER